MKKVSTLIAVFAATAMMAVTAGCSGGNTQTNSNTQSVQEITEKTTEKATEKPTEPPTEKPTENMKNTAYQAYLEYLHSHPEWFTNAEQDFIRATEKCLIAIYDINGDGMDDVIHFRPGDGEKRLNVFLTIVTYNNGVQTLYNDYVVNLPGAEAGFSVFIGDDNKMFSVTAKELNGHVIRFDMNGTNLSAQTLADSQAHHLAEPDEAVCHVDGKDVSYEEFNDYRKAVEDDSIIRKHIETTVIGKTNLRFLTAKSISDFANQKAESGLSVKTVNDILIVVGLALNFAEEVYQIPKIKVSFLKERAKEIRVLDISEQKKLEAFLIEEMNLSAKGSDNPYESGTKPSLLCEKSF